MALAIAAKDIRAELRRKAALVAALVFAALILVIFNFARDPTAIRPDQLAPSALWITVTFASVTALNRAFAVELDHGALDGLLLAPVGREAIYLGKLLGNLAFVGLVQAVTIPLFVLFFNLDLRGALPGILLLAALASVGFTAVGTVFSALTVRVQFNELMLPVLLLPFMVPPLIGAAQVTTRLLAGRTLGESAGWLQILLVYDIVFVTLCFLVFPAVLDE
ncbi:MAG: heme exporter protein CcmB [Gemmatimonadales bacterium]|nr:heme exporter protein CcmB [Gemmatimonadales bacterium]